MEIKCQTASHGVSRKFSFYSRVRQLQFLRFGSSAPLDRKPALVINDIVINKGASISFGRADSVIGYGGRGPAWDRPLTNWSDGREGPRSRGQYQASGEAALIEIAQDEMVVPAVSKLIADMKIWHSVRSRRRIVLSAKMKLRRRKACRGRGFDNGIENAFRKGINFHPKPAGWWVDHFNEILQAFSYGGLKMWAKIRNAS